MPLNTPVPALRTVYCPHCHLATRADCERCLHCGTTVSPDNQSRRTLTSVDKAAVPTLNPSGKKAVKPRFAIMASKIE